MSSMFTAYLTRFDHTGKCYCIFFCGWKQYPVKLEWCYCQDLTQTSSLFISALINDDYMGMISNNLLIRKNDQN